MAILPHDPEEQVTKAMEPLTNSTKLGDGYEVVSPKGINHNLASWSVQWRQQQQSLIDQLDEFFIEHGGWMAFQWTPRGEQSPRWYRCKSWSRSYEHDVVVQSMTATFEEVLR